MTKEIANRDCAAFGVAVPPQAWGRALNAVLLGLFTATGLTPALAETYYVDLFRGSPDGDGSLSRPWLDLDRVLAQEPLQPGDEVYLGGGAWGTLRLEGISFAEPGLFLTSFPPETPKLDGLEIVNSHGLHLSVMVVQAGDDDRTDLVRIDATSSDITIEEFDIISAPDSHGWTREQWQSIPRNAIRSDGKDVRISGNWIETVRHGVQSTGPGAIIEANIISQFTGDAIRVLGDGSVVHGNEIFNCLDVDGNHDDGIQSWSMGEDGTPGTGVVSDVKQPYPLQCAGEGRDGVTTFENEV